MVGDMTRPSEYSPSESGETRPTSRARVSANLDTADSTAPEISHYSSTEKLDTALTATRST